MIFDGALEGAVSASRIGRADGAHASFVEGWDVQADVGAHDERGDWFPEEGPAGPRGLAGGWRGLPGLGARGSRGRGGAGGT